MKAARVLPPLLLSIIIHAALIAIFPWQSHPRPSPGVTRVTLRTALVTQPRQAQAEKHSPTETPAPKRQKAPAAPKPVPPKPATRQPAQPPPKAAEAAKPEQSRRPADDAPAQGSTPGSATVESAAADALNGAGGEGAPDAGAPSPRVVDVSELAVLKKTLPEYPQLSRRRREEGTVTVLIDIESGRVTAAKVEHGSGYTPLDESALRAVRQWRFAVLDMPVTARVRIAFRLNAN